MYVSPQSIQTTADTVEAFMDRAVVYARRETNDPQVRAALIAAYVDACVRALTRQA